MKDTLTYLSESFETITPVGNGYYDVTDSNGNRFFVPENFDETTKLYGFIPGTTRVGKDEVIKMMSAEEPPHVLAAIAQETEDYDNILELGTNIIIENGSTVSSVTLQSISRGGSTGYVSLNEYLGNHPELGDHAAYVSNDGGFLRVDSDFGMDLSDLKNLIKYQVPVIKLNPQQKVHHLKPLMDAGINVIGMSTYTDHNEQNKKAFRSGIALYINGEKDEIGNVNIYRFYTYDYETGKIRQLESSILEKYRISELSDPLTVWSFDKDHQIESFINQYKTQSNFETKTNLDYIMSSMNSIRTSISSSSALSVKGSNGTGELSQYISENIKRYFNDVADTLSKLEQETNSIASVGMAINDMDIDLEKHANDIASVGTIVEIIKSEQKGDLL